LSNKNIIFTLLFVFILLCLCFPHNNKYKEIDEFLYGIEKIYYEDLFIKRDIYTVEDLKNYFLERCGKSKEEAFKETLYTFVKDPFLEIREKQVFESNYYKERDVENDIKIKRVDENIYLITFYQISPNMAKKYKEYLTQNIDKNSVIIIDLTNNLGGSLWSAAFFISLFFEPNTYLFSVNFLKKNGIKTQNFYNSADFGGYFVNNLVAVLQDDTTVSAAEVISGVLKKRALIFGDFTFGKPYIQSVFDVGNLTIVYTNAFLNFSLELEPHSKIRPDFYLNPKEIEKKIIIQLVRKLNFFLSNKGG